jgi:N-acetylmuramoyl-L-alanine amidase
MTILRPISPSGPARVALLLLLGLLAGPQQGTRGQSPQELRVQTPAGLLSPGIPLVTHDGVVVVGSKELVRLGWEVEEEGGLVRARWKGGQLVVEIRTGTPFFSWGGEGVQLVEAPFTLSDQVYLPLQFLIDILPWKLPEFFGYDPDTRTLEVLDGGSRGVSSADPRRIVVIDPGHGGRDSGARGNGGTREKDLALSIGRALARILEADPDYEVHLTRDEDVLIPLWKRGEQATGWKGEGHGIFISIHANAMPTSRAARGFETYYLSEARTEHERRVAALENAAQELENVADQPPANSDLSSILSELRNLDHQHWSALLAEMIQEELARVHPGPNRGVKQGPFAVITNALMPAVLVEVGFVTNADEERLLAQAGFQEEAAQAVARAVQEFFKRYPPGGTG